jgi:hypothetical protein
MTLADHRQEKERKGKNKSPCWIGTSTRVIARLNTLAGRIGTSTRLDTTHNVDREDKARQQLPPADLYVSKPSEGSATGKDQRDGTTAPKRATAVQDPPPQCCCSPADHLTVCRNTESEMTNARGPRRNRPWTLACAGTSNPPLSTPLARARDHPTRRTAPHPGLVPRIAAMIAKEVPRPPGTEPSRQTNTEVRIITLLRPRTEPPPSSQKTERCRPRRLPTMHRTREFSCAESPTAIRCRPSRHKLSLPQAPSKQRCPAPHWRMPNNTRHRGTLQADE